LPPFFALPMAASNAGSAAATRNETGELRRGKAHRVGFVLQQRRDDAVRGLDGSLRVARLRQVAPQAVMQVAPKRLVPNRQ
jgi:hypothetical protein